jgi:hypothetical protein
MSTSRCGIWEETTRRSEGGFGVSGSEDCGTALNTFPTQSP